MEFLDLEADAGRIDQLGEQDAALQQRDGGAVLHRGAEHHVGRGDPRRDVLHDDRGIARDVPAEMTRGDARLQVVAAAGTGADDDGELLAGVEILGGSGRGA